MPRSVAFVAVAAIVTLGGCSFLGLGGDEEDEAEVAAAERVVEASYEPVLEVTNIEVGRTRNGIVITALGVAPGLGYAAPELRPRRDGQPGPEGYLDFDFVARAPATPVNAAQASPRARLVRADHLIALAELRGARGIRIHAAEGGMLMNF